MLADVAIFSVTGIEYAGALSDPLAALVFTVRQRSVDYLIVNGIMRIRKGSTAVDEENLIRDHNRISFEMLKSAEERTGINFGLRQRGM